MTRSGRRSPSEGSAARRLRTSGALTVFLNVERHLRLTLPESNGSKAWDADRRRDPKPIYRHRDVATERISDRRFPSRSVLTIAGLTPDTLPDGLALPETLMTTSACSHLTP